MWLIRDVMWFEEIVLGCVDMVGGLVMVIGNVVLVLSKQISLEEDMFCQCDLMEDVLENCKFIYLECKNFDGMIYL